MVDREEFYTKFYEFLNSANKRDNCFLLSREKYNMLLEQVKAAKIKCTSTSDYRRVKRYDIIQEMGEEKLIAPLYEGDTNIRYYVTNEEIFDILNDTHIRLGHKGRNKMVQELQLKYKNITYETVMLFLNICSQCQLKRSGVRFQKRERAVVKPRITYQRQMPSSVINIESTPTMPIAAVQSPPTVLDGPGEYCQVLARRLRRLTTVKQIMLQNKIDNLVFEEEMQEMGMIMQNTNAANYNQ